MSDRTLVERRPRPLQRCRIRSVTLPYRNLQWRKACHTTIPFTVQRRISAQLLSFEERVQAVMAFGFTPRQAAFLTTVMVHAGVCLPRQYTTFCRIVFGHTTRDFFARLVRDRFATAYTVLATARRKPVSRALQGSLSRHRRA